MMKGIGSEIIDCDHKMRVLGYELRRIFHGGRKRAWTNGWGTNRSSSLDRHKRSTRINVDILTYCFGRSVGYRPEREISMSI